MLLNEEIFLKLFNNQPPLDKELIKKKHKQKADLFYQIIKAECLSDIDTLSDEDILYATEDLDILTGRMTEEECMKSEIEHKVCRVKSSIAPRLL